MRGICFIHVPLLRVQAVAMYPFILIRSLEMKTDEVLINHERIHHRQQLELLILPFYILYISLFLYHLIRLRNHYRAYRAIIFEREAFAMDTDLEYLKRRKWWAFLKL